jgi:hypothetical protein
MKRALGRTIGVMLLLVGGVCAGFAQQPAATEISGGNGGNTFSDLQIPDGARVVEVQVRSGEQVDSVQMVYGLPDGRTAQGPRHGGSGGGANVFRLDDDEYIVGISGRCGLHIDSLSIRTNKRTSPVYGGRGGDREFRIDIPPGNQAVGFTGRSGNLLDAVGLTYSLLQLVQIGETSIGGGSGGSAFSDKDAPHGSRIIEVRVQAGDWGDGIQAVYLTSDGRTIEGARHGGSGGGATAFRLDSDEYIVGISGRFGKYIDSLQIRTNKRTSQVFGGRGGDRDFRVDVPAGTQAVGFLGRAGAYLDALGLVYSTVPSSRRLPWRRQLRP